MEPQYVVIIDDDQDDCDLLEESFSLHHTLPVKTFNKPSLFFRFIDSNPNAQIALMIIDLNLPEMSGIEVIRLLKEGKQFDQAPLIVFTTGGTPAEKEFCQKHNIEKIRKPNNIEGWMSFALVMAAHCDPRLARNSF